MKDFSCRESGAKEYLIKKSGADTDWVSVPFLFADEVLWEKDAGIRASGQFCFDEGNLYVHLKAEEKDVRAENTEPLSPVFEDSCLEFFFKLKDSGNYFNFEVNPNGCLLVQFGPERADRVCLVRENAVEYFDIKTNTTADGWEVFYKIPLKFIRLFYPDYQFGGELFANVYKCGDKTTNKHYLSWNPVLLQSPDFHCPQFFGKMVFEK